RGGRPLHLSPLSETKYTGRTSGSLWPSTSRCGALKAQSPVLVCVGTWTGGQPAARAAARLSPAHLATEAKGFFAGASGLGSSMAGRGDDAGMGFRSTGGAG